MSTLKTLVQEKQQKIEEHPFYKLLLSGNISPELYALYLWEQRGRYEAIEDWLEGSTAFEGMEALKRYEKVRDDFEEIWKGQLGKKFMPQPSRSTTDMHKRLKELVEDDINDTMQGLAHVYVMHGDLLRISKQMQDKVPGTGRMFDFEMPVADLQTLLENKLTDEMAEEASYSMDLKLCMFDMLWEIANPETHYCVDDCLHKNPPDPDYLNTADH